MTQLAELAMPFPERFVHKNPSGGGSYVKHHVVNQRLIEVLGVPPSFERVEVIYGDVAEIAPNPSGSSKRAKEGRPALHNVIVAVLCRLTADIEGRRVVVEEAGDCEQPHNWDTDGQRLKDAMSDAYKRCAMRLGCGLHLWSQDEFFLYDKLSQANPTPPAPQAVVPEPEAGSTSEAAFTTAPENTEPREEAQVSRDTEAASSPPPSYSETVRAIGSYIGGDSTRRQIVQSAIKAAYKGLSLTPPAKLDTAEDYAACEEDLLKDVLHDLDEAAKASA